MDYFTTDLTSLHEKLVNKDLSVEELTKETFKTIKDRDQQIAAFLALNEEAALRWLTNGAIPTDTAKSLMSKLGIIKKFAENKVKAGK